MTGILIFQAVSGTTYLIVLSVVAIRLLLLARRTRALPELLLGLTLLIGGTFGATIEGAGMSSTGADGIPVELAGPMLLIGKVLGVVGMTIQAVFIRVVFRPESRAARLAVYAVFVLVGAPILGFWSYGTFATGEISMFWQLVQFAGRLVAPIWMFAESVRYFGFMKRRVALGLARPIVANRFLLWSVSSISGIVMLATSMPPIFLDPIAQANFLVADLFVFSVTGIITAVCYWLVLMPPKFYVRWYESSVEQAA